MTAIEILQRESPFRYQFATAPAGMTIAQIVALSFPAAADLSGVRVTIDEVVISQDIWAVAKPKIGRTIVVNLVPAGDSLRSILSVVVTVAAIAVGQFYLGPLIASTFGVTGTVATGLITGATAATLAFGGQMLVNALIPARPAGSDSNSNKPQEAYAIQGFQNSMAPDAPIPEAMGEIQWAPSYACLPYTQTVNDKQYVVATFLLGHGPLEIENPCFGETPISNYADVYTQIRYGYPDEEPISLYPEQTLEEGVGAALDYPIDDGGNPIGGLTHGTEIIRMTADDANDCEVDFFFPSGLVQFDKDGKAFNRTVLVRIEQRLNGVGGFYEQVALDITGNSRTPFSRSYRWALPSRGQWEIKVYRATIESADTAIIDRVDFTKMRSFRPEYPFAYDKPIALFTVRAKATGQLNGVINNFNCRTKLIVKDWNGSAWVTQASNNPASLFRRALQSRANSFPKADEEIDLAGLQAWHLFCQVRGLTYNRVHNFDAPLETVLADIAAAGRATPRFDGEKWGVVVDEPKTEIVAHITSRNSWGFQGETAYPKTPDAFRVQFLDETNGYKSTERIIPFPDFVGEPQILEEISMPGVTDPVMVFKEARRRQYELQLRPHAYTVSQDIEGLECTRGDLVVLSHDILDEDLASARVERVKGRTVKFDDQFSFEAGQNYCIRFRLADGSSLLRTVTAAPGLTSVVRVSGDLTGVAEGDLAMFGTSARGESLELIVNRIEYGENLTCQLSLVDHSPEIDSLTAAVVPTTWTGRYGSIVDFTSYPPAVPSIARVITDPDTLDAQITVRANDTNGALTTAFILAHRLSGSGSFTEVRLEVAESVVLLNMYEPPDIIDIKVKALNFAEGESAFSTVETYQLHVGPTMDDTLSAAQVPFYSFDSDQDTMDTV